MSRKRVGIGIPKPMWRRLKIDCEKLDLSNFVENLSLNGRNKVPKNRLVTVIFLDVKVSLFLRCMRMNFSGTATV